MNLADLQKAMASEPQADCPVTHYFSDGIYARELFIPKGVALVGAKHKTNHLMMIMKGRCLIADNNGASFEVEAPYVTETKKGTKRAITALEDTIMIGFHVTDKKNPLDIGEEILEKEENILPQWKEKALEDMSCG